MKKEVLLIVSVVLVIFGMLFYWFAYRQTEIKKECSQKIINAVSNSENKDVQVNFEKLYDLCVKSKGL